VGAAGPVASGAVEVRTTDYHTAGEPFRIVVEGAPELPGATVAERRALALESEPAQRIRRFLCHEPRGHADMYGGFVVEPDDAGAELGVLFWHKDGFSTACGHGTIALAAWAVESGRLEAPIDGELELAIDVPSGRVGARVRMEGGAVAAVTFRNVPAYVLARDVEVETAHGRLAVDVSYGGAIYASLPAADAGLAVVPEDLGALTALGREIKWALNEAEVARHPSDERLSGIYGTIWFDDLGPAHQRNVAIFADGEVDRSPCGSGTSARAALLAADGRLPAGTELLHESIVGSAFRARVVEQVREEGREAVVTEIEGSAHRTGEHRFVLDPRDPLADGFVLR
jgi:proline racemase